MKKNIILIAMSCVLASCQVINYTPTSTSKESDFTFSRITTKEQNVCPPLINRFDQLYWYSPTTIDVSTDEQKLLYIKEVGSKRELYLYDQYLKDDKGIVLMLNVFDMSFGEGDSIVYFTCSKSDTKLVPSRARQNNNFQGVGMVNKTIVNDDDGHEYISYSGVKRYHKYPNLSIYKVVLGTFDREIIVDTEDLDFGADLGKKRQFFFSSGIYEDFSTFTVNQETGEVKELFAGFAPSVDEKNGLVYYVKINKELKRSEILVYNSETEVSTLILSDSLIGFSTPQISHDGTKLLLVGATPVMGETQMNLDLYVYEIDSGNFLQLTSHVGNDLSPRWAPNDKSIYFLSQRGNLFGKYNIWQLKL